MLGLIGEGTGIAAKVLKSMGEYTEHSCFPASRTRRALSAVPNDKIQLNLTTPLTVQPSFPP